MSIFDKGDSGDPYEWVSKSIIRLKLSLELFFSVEQVRAFSIRQGAVTGFGDETVSSGEWLVVDIDVDSKLVE